jgi:hypothetical protein
MSRYHQDVLDMLEDREGDHNYDFVEWAEQQYSVADLLSLQPIHEVVISHIGDEFVDELVEDVVINEDFPLRTEILRLVPSEVYDKVLTNLKRRGYTK